MSYKKELAKVTVCEINEVWEGFIGLRVSFDLESGCSQGLAARALDASFVLGFMGVFRAKTLKEIVGKSCWIYASMSDISRIEPLHASDGKPFDIQAWEKWRESRCVCKLSFSELQGAGS